PEDVGDVDHRRLVAHGAVLRRRLTDVPGRPQELGVGVAHVQARQAALLELADDHVAGQPVVDLPGEGRTRADTPHDVVAEAHALARRTVRRRAMSTADRVPPPGADVARAEDDRPSAGPCQWACQTRYSFSIYRIDTSEHSCCNWPSSGCSRSRSCTGTS